MFLLSAAFESFGYIPTTGIAGSHDSFTLSLFFSDFHHGCTNSPTKWLLELLLSLLLPVPIVSVFILFCFLDAHLNLDKMDFQSVFIAVFPGI